MKIINLVAASVLLATASVAMADSTGFYAGVLAGYGKVDYTSNDGAVTKNHGIDGGINVGYMFNNNFGVETGFMQYSKVKLIDGTSITQNYSIHVAGVAKYNLTDTVNVYGKLGVADVHSKYPADDNGKSVGYSKAALFAAAGVGYDVTQNIETSFEVDATTKSHNEVAGMYSANVGVAYKF